jgi:4a-hydroxytetrahydrobiopterin dehydratase
VFAKGNGCEKLAVRPGFIVRIRETSPPSQTMPSPIAADAIPNWMKKVPKWEHEGDSIERSFEFDDFPAAIEFVNAVAEVAEEAFHHPDIHVRYTAVTLSLTTHDKGGLTGSDFELASRIDHLVD